MKQFFKIIMKSITIVATVVMLFSCTNNSQQVRDFLADKNLPIGVAKKAFHVYKDSGRITSKLYTPLMLDFSNREEHPYSEFPKGIRIVNFEKNGIDSVTITGDYALSYAKTEVSEIIGNVVILNHSEDKKLETEQMYWDQKTKYFFSEKPFLLITKTHTIKGTGFESKEDLSKWVSKKISGQITTNEEE